MTERDNDNPTYRMLEEVGRRRGYLTRADIVNAIPEAEFDHRLVGELSQSFSKAGIPIHEEDEGLSESPEAMGGDIDLLADTEDIEDDPSEINLAQADTDDILRLYLQEATTHPLLTIEQEVDLAQRIERCLHAYQELSGGDVSQAREMQLARIIEEGRAAREQLIRANTRLVISVARRYANRGLPLIDLVQEGNIGLMRAVRNFDHRRGFRFSTYATWWIRQAVTRAITNQGRIIRLPAYVSDQVSRLRRIELDLQQRLNRNPNSEELAEAMGLPQETIEAMLSSLAQPTSLESTIGDDEDMELGDLLEDENSPNPEDTVSDMMDRAQVISLLDHLPLREQQIIKLRFGLGGDEPLTLSEIGNRLGITRERARQLELQALERLRNPTAAGQRKRRGPAGKGE